MGRGLIKIAFWACLLLFSAVGWADPEGENLPCWAFRPVHGDTVGAVGWARADYRPDQQAAQRARFRAAYQLATYAGAGKEGIFRAAGLQDRNATTGFGRSSIGFPYQFRTEARIYVYGVLDPRTAEPPPKACQRVCQPAECQPPWLCQPMGQDQAGFLGVSAGARTLHRQYRLAVSNAQALMKLIYGVEVKAISAYEQKQKNGESSRRSQQESDLDFRSGQVKNTRVIPAARCRSGQHAFVHVLAPDLDPLPGSQKQDWFSNPHLGEKTGGIGSSVVPVSGRISEQITIAIRKALVALAMAKDVHVTGETKVARDKDGRFMLQRVAQSTEALVKGKVAGLRFLGEGIERRVRVWVVEAGKEGGSERSAGS